jgi:cytidine deaminase
MKSITLEQHIKVCKTADELPKAYQELLEVAHKATSHAYAPYSKFNVGAAVLLNNGQIVIGSNQENASYPVGVCAERVAITAASAQYPGVKVKAVAISAKAKRGKTDNPVAPCGICRQTILEYELLHSQNIELILQGETGDIYWIPSAKTLLPLFFSHDNLK